MPTANEFDHLVHDGCQSAICPYCDEPIVDGPTEHYGSLLLHAECYRKFGESGLDDIGDGQPSEDELDYAYRRYYGF